VGASPSRAREGAAREEEDNVAVEEPLEIRIHGDPVATTMRTPGEDRLLALGFLFAEGILRSRDDVSSVAHCGHPGEEGYGNVIEVTPSPGARIELEKVSASRRGSLTTSACGVCGRRSVDDLVAACGTVGFDALRVPASWIAQAPESLRKVQTNFARTGGVHAAAALSLEGGLLAAFEDVGRHNAVDKVVGALLVDNRLGTPFSSPPVEDARRAVLLMVSGRASFELVQKAAVARIPLLASVSAASSLAVDLARRTGVTLATFVRDGHFNLFSHPERVEP
jgi:FdhD protein